MTEAFGWLLILIVSLLTGLQSASAADAPRLLVQSGPQAIWAPQLVVAPDKTLVASTGLFGRGSVYIWQVATGRFLCMLPAQLEGGGMGIMGGGVANFAFSKDGAQLATSSPNGVLQLWDLRRCEKGRAVQLGGGRSTHGMLTTRQGDLLVLGGDGMLYAGDVFAGKALSVIGRSSDSSELLHGVSADGRFVLVSAKAGGGGFLSGWITRVIDTSAGTSEALSNEGGKTDTSPMSMMAKMMPPAAALSPSGRWVLRFQAGQVELIDRSRRVVTGSAAMVQAAPLSDPQRPAAAPDAQRPSVPGRVGGCPPPATAGPQEQARCDRLDKAMRTLGGTGMAEMSAAVGQMKKQMEQQGPAAFMPPWFGFSEREDAVYIWRNPSPAMGQRLAPNQRSVIEVRKLPDLALVRQAHVQDHDSLAPFLGATATGFAPSHDASMLAVGLLSTDLGAGRLGVVDLASLGEAAPLRSWKPSGGSSGGLEWAADGRLLTIVTSQRVGAASSLAGRSAGPGPAGMPTLPSGLPGMPSMGPMPSARVGGPGGPPAPSPDSYASTVVQWPMASGEVTSRSVATTSARPARLSAGGRFAAVMKLNVNAADLAKSRATIEILETVDMQRVREIELTDDSGLPLWVGEAGGAERFAISSDGQRMAAIVHRARSESPRGGGGGTPPTGHLSLHDANTGKQLAALELPVFGGGVEFLDSDGSSMWVATENGRQRVTVADGRLVAAPLSDRAKPLAVFAGDPVHAVVGTSAAESGATAASGAKLIRLASKDTKAIQLDASGTRLAVAGRVAEKGAGIDLYDVHADGSAVKTSELTGQQGNIDAMAFSPDGRFLASAETSGATSIWNLASGSLLARLFAFEDGTWAVVDSQGRFDTNNIEDLEYLHWVMPDDPLRALPLDIFMRDYFSPGLLARLVRGEALPPVRPVGDLNRAQPILRIASVSPSRDDARRVDVTVEAVGQTDARGRAGGVADVRLFRDGRLVGYPQRPGEALRLDPTTHRATVTFRGIRLPQGAASVGFSAYAFNTDRVKSATVRSAYRVPAGANAKYKGKAYVIAIGVNKYDNATFDLQYAANDARLAKQVLSDRITAEHAHREVVPVMLVSEGEGLRDATKARIRAVLDVLAGRTADRKELAGVANASRLEAATPDDLVIITFAGHGHAGDAGVFHLLPQDIVGTELRITPELLARSISTDELETWLRDVDAGELAMVIDACYSAASVQGDGFKPGPMGSRGLGQLAYDKGMRVLAASQSNDVAIEADRLRQGLLTFALMRDGIEARRADFRPQDKRIHLGEWLAYGVEGVPSLQREMAGGQRAAGRGMRAAQRVGGTLRVQQPRLFDFSRRGDGPVIESSP